MKADYVHKDTLTATDYVDLQKENDLIISYNQQLLKENQQLKIQISDREEVYKELEDNWNDLKEFLETNWKETQDIWFVKIINRMQELERGSSSDE